MVYVGIDPGGNGGMCIIYDDFFGVGSGLFNKKSYILRLKDLLNNYKKENIIIGLELVHSMPKQGVRSMFTFGENFGWIQGVLDTLEFEYELIRPQEWKKHFYLIGSDKKQSCVKALELEPTLKCYGKRGGLQDGICDSYLIARYLKDKYESKGIECCTQKKILKK